MTGDRQSHIAGSILPLVIRLHLTGGQRCDTLICAKDALAQRMIGKVSRHDIVVRGERRHVVIHPDFFEDDVLLHVEVIGSQ